MSLRASWASIAPIREAIVGVVGTFPSRMSVPRQQRTRVAQREFAPGLLGQGAFVTGALSGDEDTRQAEPLLDGAVDPRLAHPVAEAVDRQPRLAVVEAADDDIHAPHHTQAELRRDVAMQILDVDVGVEGLGARRHDFGFGAAGVLFAEEDRTAEVGRFDVSKSIR